MYVCMFGEQHYIAKKETGKSHCPQGILAIANAEGAPMETSWVNYYTRLTCDFLQFAIEKFLYS